MNDDRARTGHRASTGHCPPVLLITLRRLFGPGGPQPLLCRMRYTADDPYAVALDLFADLDTDVRVTWVVARDLLTGQRQGLTVRVSTAGTIHRVDAQSLRLLMKQETELSDLLLTGVSSRPTVR
ncbi:SsgA family sporulation/cell division regulator [Streptomyces sp. NPDC057052]|uniref:SsgA family sporulation/cell division regulator n=1 Tax=Streptomyces sp. NPDC057052 TaxID=3346010 RepID=UPI003640DAF2